MKKFLSKHAFWVVQILGCFAFVCMVYVLVGTRGDAFTRTLFAVAMFLTFFIPTTLLRFLYKGFVKIDAFSFIELIKILSFLLVTIILVEKLPYYLGYIMGSIADFLGAEGKLETDFTPNKTEGLMKYIGGFVICSGWTILYFLIKQFRKQYADRLSRLDLKDKIKQAQLNTLKGHLNPQFMVTALANIKQLMLTDVTSARNRLTKLSEILRYSLTKNNINSVVLEEELKIVKKYVALLGIDNKGFHTVSFEMPIDTLKFGIPPMLFTNLMEIATKNGILQKKEGGHVILSAVLLDQVLQIKVNFSSKIFRNSETDLLEQTIKQRLRLLFKNDASYAVGHELNETTIKLLMPLTIIQNSKEPSN